MFEQVLLNECCRWDIKKNKNLNIFCFTQNLNCASLDNNLHNVVIIKTNIINIKYKIDNNMQTKFYINDNLYQQK